MSLQTATNISRGKLLILGRDSKLIPTAPRGTLDGTLSFPEVVGKLLAAGVEYYQWITPGSRLAWRQEKARRWQESD
jgi:hypothetical protein